MANILKKVSVVLTLFVLFVAGLTLRRYVLDAQRPLADGELPFTLEGAIHFHRVQQLLTTGQLPVVDRNIEYPSGIHVRETDTVTDTYLGANLSKLLPASIPLAERLRWVEVLWFCLGIPLLAWWVWLGTRSWWGGLVAAVFYAVALASVIRSTGQELSHENLALPLLIASLAAATLAGRVISRGLFWVSALAAATLLAGALMTWDLIQFFIFLWALWLVWRIALSRAPLLPREMILAGLQILALIVAGVWNPYLRAHGFLLSPPLLLAVGALLVAVVRRIFQGLENELHEFSKAWKIRVGWLLLALLPLVFGLFVARTYGAAYGHFGELLAAKLRFLNVKPDDPALLTFNQRILWVPALHSATWQLTFTLFPAILAASCLALVCLAPRKNKVRDSNLSLVITCLVVAGISYWFFVRLHVFVILFMAALLGWWAAWSVRRGWGWSLVVAVLVLVALAVEAGQTVRAPEGWGRGNVYYRELAGLTDWLRKNVAPEPVLANFGVSASILAYGNCPILVHPKFESPTIRDRVRAYGEVLFKGTEEQFRDWAEREGALYYVHALGEFASVGINQQMRYMVNALQPRADTAAWLFERVPQQLKWFVPVWSNAKYRVFRIRCRADAQIAADQAEVADQALQLGQLDRAERYALEALARAPENLRAQTVLRHSLALRDQGVGLGRDEKK